MNFAPADAYQLCLALPGSFLTMLGTPFCAALYKMDLHSSTHSVSCYQSRWQEQGSYSCLQFSWHQEQSLHTNSSISTCWPTPPWRSATRCRKDSPAQHSGLSVTYTKNWVKHEVKIPQCIQMFIVGSHQRLDSGVTYHDGQKSRPRTRLTTSLFTCG